MKIPFQLLLVFILLSLVSRAQITAVNTGKFDFQQLTFHSTECNGTCPAISVNVYSDKTIELSRTIYSKKGVADTTRSGNYKGSLSEKDYGTLLTLLKQVDWGTITFPKVTCCDGPVKTIILTYNDKYKRYKSMTPPQETRKLIDFLTQLGTQIKLPAYDKAIDFEDVLD